MGCHRISFTERRRRRLALKFDTLLSLETRNTITEPISPAALTISALRSLAQLGLVQIHGGSDALEALQTMSEAARLQRSKATPIPILAAPRTTTFLPIAAGSQTNEGWAGTSAPVAPLRPRPRPVADSANENSNSLNLAFAPSESSQPAISIPARPARLSGGGAFPGAGAGANPAPAATVPPRAAASPPSSTSAPTASGFAPAAFFPAPSQGSAGIVASRGQPARGLLGSADRPAGGLGALAPPANPLAGVAENAWSQPYTGSGIDSPAAQGSFPYYPLYVLDFNNGVILFPGQYQQAAQFGYVDLRAQVRDTTGVTFSWDTSHLTYASNITGASTYRLQFQWSGTIPNATVSYTTLTATNGSSQQESQTFYFLLPSTNIVSMPNSASWPETVAPDTARPEGSAFASHDLGVDANTGAVDTSIPLPAYNPNIPGLSLTYDSLTADPRPIILEHHTLDASQSAPTKVSAQLTFDGTAGTAYYYDTSKFTPGDIEAIGLQADATGKSTGRFNYSVQVVDYRATNTTFTLNGTTTVLNYSSSAFGAGWTLQGLEKITAATGGVILDLGGGGRSLWFTGSGGTYTSPAGEFSTLVKNGDNTYTRTLTNGTKINFDTSGNETSVVDRNNLHTTLAYSSGLLSTITDPYGKVVTFAYSSGKLATIQDAAGRLATFTISGGTLNQVQQADGSFVTYTYSSNRLIQRKDPNAQAVSVVYDAGNRASTITRPDGTTETFKAYQERGYDTSGTSGSPAPATLLAEARGSYTDPNGHTTDVRTDWSALGLANQMTDPDGNVATLDLNSSGLPIVGIDRINRISQFTYDSSGNITKQVYPDLNMDQYSYNSFSEPLTHTDASNHTTSYSYDGNGNLTGEQDPLGNRATLTYTGNGRLQTVKDANNRTTSYQYDSQDRLTVITFADGTTNQLAYDSKGNIATVTDERGYSTTASYDALNRCTGTTDALGNRTTYGYDPNGNLTSVQAPLSRTTNYAYDSMDRVTTVTDALSHSTIYGYDPAGNLQTVKDALNRVTTLGYDAENRLTVRTDPLGKSTTIAYDADGQQASSKDPLGRTTSFSYSNRGFLATVTDPLGNVVTYTYTATGKMSAEYHVAGSQLTSRALTYDADDRLSSSNDGAGDITTYLYDGVGNRTAVQDGLGHTTSSAYDSRNRIVSITDALNHVTTVGYDAAGNQQSVTDALGHTATTLYDALDRAATIINALGGATTILYDTAGRTIGLVDPVGNRTTWAYDAGDRLTTMTDALNHSATYVYDNANQLTDQTDRDGRRTTFSYDNDGRRTGETWVGASPSELITATYDDAGQLTKLQDANATLTFAYDNAGRMTTAVTSGPGTGQPTVTLVYAYDPSGNRTGLTDSLASQGVTSYAYDGASRVTSIAQSFGGTDGPRVVFGYDYASRLTSISRQIGNGSTATQVNTTFVYDNANRVGTIQQSRAVWMGFGYNTTPLTTIVYGYDAANRVTTQVDAEGTATLTYDNTNQLTAVGGSRTESYGYDANGNRNTTGYTTGTDNEMTASPGATYSYDAEGNMMRAITIIYARLSTIIDGLASLRRAA
jgi:YD repeat-containing protein